MAVGVLFLFFMNDSAYKNEIFDVVLILMEV